MKNFTNTMRDGLFSDVYFNRTKEILEQDGCHLKVLMQIFQKNDRITVCGIEEAISILREATGYFSDEEFIKCWNEIKVMALRDGDKANAFETIMTIEGDYSLFAHLETIYLGILSRRTMVATNVNRAVEVANGKPILFFSARFDHFLNQPGDGYAAHIAGASGVSTDAQAYLWNGKGIGTVPHSLIAAYSGDTVKATLKFTEWAKKQNEEIKIIALVDFENDCVGTSLAVANACENLWGVRLDTSGLVVDKSIVGQMGQFDPRGVNPQLVRNVRNALDANGFDLVKIVVSGGFNCDKIARFEKRGVPADVYAVGSSFFKGNFDFTADIVKPVFKVGRGYNPNPRLKIVD